MFEDSSERIDFCVYKNPPDFYLRYPPAINLPPPGYETNPTCFRRCPVSLLNMGRGFGNWIAGIGVPGVAPAPPRPLLLEAGVSGTQLNAKAVRWPGTLTTAGAPRPLRALRARRTRLQWETHSPCKNRGGGPPGPPKPSELSEPAQL